MLTVQKARSTSTAGISEIEIKERANIFGLALFMRNSVLGPQRASNIHKDSLAIPLFPVLA